MKAHDKRVKLWKMQAGLCHHCNGKMRLVRFTNKSCISPKDATLEHLDCRFSPKRGRSKGKLRVVASCWQCNFDRGKEIEAATPNEIRQMRYIDRRKHFRS